MAKKKDENDGFALALLALGGFWLWSRKARGAAVVVPTYNEAPEIGGPVPGVTTPSADADDIEGGEIGGVRWAIWNESAAPQFRAWHGTARGVASGELLADARGWPTHHAGQAYGTTSATASGAGTAADKIDARTVTGVDLAALIREVTGLEIAPL
jgi:MYXO-CTERM domain-containing protein